MSDIIERAEESTKLFYEWLGRTMDKWSSVESKLCHAFQQVTGMHPPLARSIFYSARSFLGRIDMLDAAIGAANFKQPALGNFLKAATKKAKQYSSTRNLLAHGDIIYVEVKGAALDRQTVIVQGRDSGPPQPETALTQTHLENAEDNFARLSYCLQVVLNWDGHNYEYSPDRFIDLIHALPNIAHSLKLDSNFTESFAIKEELFAESR